ncbi:MAG: hypothetical protein CMM60_04810 [Rhodospirillaceae bacterium]|jgi:predicted DNA-binding protein with PD1-like motif|nr:hypothetical protein [Rhodospirillaceae bacterium]|tara:strand:+ start:381 stop:878 length:498 start_codon:yes stop_codon:yes gene_type:complete
MAETLSKEAVGAFGRVVVARIMPGADFLEALESIAARHNITSGVILSGIATFTEARFHAVKLLTYDFPYPKEGFAHLHMDEVLELVSVSGTIAEYEQKPMIHCHMTVASGNKEGKVWGGHVMKGTIVYATAEIVIAEVVGMKMVRETDPMLKTPQLVPLAINDLN